MTRFLKSTVVNTENMKTFLAYSEFTQPNTRPLYVPYFDSISLNSTMLFSTKTVTYHNTFKVPLGSRMGKTFVCTNKEKSPVEVCFDLSEEFSINMDPVDTSYLIPAGSFFEIVSGFIF